MHKRAATLGRSPWTHLLNKAALKKSIWHSSAFLGWKKCDYSNIHTNRQDSAQQIPYMMVCSRNLKTRLLGVVFSDFRSGTCLQLFLTGFRNQMWRPLIEVAVCLLHFPFGKYDANALERQCLFLATTLLKTL